MDPFDPRRADRGVGARGVRHGAATAGALGRRPNALSVCAAAAFVGWLGLYAAAFISTLIAAIIDGFLILLRRAHMPEAPFLFARTLVTVVLLSL